jgi:hypothetical protein
LTFCLASCTEDPPTPPPPSSSSATIELSLDEAGVTEVWLRVKVSGVLLPTSWVLERNGINAIALNTAPADTVVMDDSLEPGQIQHFRAIRFENQTRVDSTPLLQVRTMDTTSHEFTWELQYLGDGSSSGLYDVAIINDTLAYAVGEIYLQDSTGQLDLTAYNAARWNGESWKVLRVPYMYQGSPFVSATYWVFALSDSEIWFGNSVYWDGHGFQNVDLAGSVFYGIGSKKMWGSSRSDLILVGNSGTIARFNGTRWTQVQSGTTMPIVDIWGSTHSASGQTEVLCLASDQFRGTESLILRLDGTTAVPVSSDGLPWSLATLWFISGRRYIIAGDGLYSSPTLGPTWRRDSTLPSLYKTTVRGTGLNNLFVVGAFGLVLHHNGMSWRDLTGQVGFSDGSFGGMDAKGRLVIAVGGTASRAAVLIGRRIGS